MMRSPNMYLAEIEREVDGRWIAEILAIPGALAYGSTPEVALQNVNKLADKIVADLAQHRERLPKDFSA